MTTYEYIALTMLTLLFVLFILLIVGVGRKPLFAIFINGIIGVGIYFVLIMTELLEPTRQASFTIGLIGLLYYIALPFI